MRANGNHLWNTLARIGQLQRHDALMLTGPNETKPEMANSGKRLIIAAELEGHAAEHRMVKQLFYDEIEAEKKYKDPFKRSHAQMAYTPIIFQRSMP